MQINNHKDDFLSVEFYREETEIDIENICIEVSKSFSVFLFDELKKNLLSDIESLLTPKTFEGEAIEYIKDNNLIFTPKTVKEYSIAICNSFIKNIDDAIFYDSESKEISISPYIFSLEFGDYFRPGVSFISNKIKDTIKFIEEHRNI